MKTIVAGYKYQLDSFEGGEPQTLQFIHKDAPVRFGEPAPIITVSDGTTNEEVLAVLIDRLRFLSAKLPSRETSIAITKLEEAQMWLEKRTVDRRSRGVEGTRQP